MPQIVPPSKLINCTDLSTCFQALYNFSFTLFLALCFLMFVYGAFQYLLSGAGIFSKEEGKKRMINSIIALIVILVIPLILNLINPQIFQAKLKIPKVEATLPEITFYMPQGTTIQGKPVSGPIPIGNICQMAESIAKEAGIRPAFLLAILKVETNFGNYIGGCSYNALNSGGFRDGGDGSNCQLTVLPDNKCSWFCRREKECFENQIKQYVDINSIKFNSVGAMGPMQFMPCTWVGYSGAVLQKFSSTNPWELSHALYAGALKLCKDGACQGDEVTAACRYYGACADYYTNPVIKLANEYDSQYLKNGSCPQ